jgi:hypothetical protein
MEIPVGTACRTANVNERADDAPCHMRDGPNQALKELIAPVDVALRQDPVADFDDEFLFVAALDDLNAVHAGRQR